MNCKKCGKFITSGDYCRDCKATMFDEMNKDGASRTVYEAHVVDNQVDLGRMVGFGKAITGGILGIVSFAVVLVAFVFGIIEMVNGFLGVSLGTWVCSLPMGILAVMFGIQSVRLAFRVKKASDKMPVATLVLGFVGIAAGTLTLLFALVTFVLILIALAKLGR